MSAIPKPEPICTYLDWDSEFFGQRIARANQSRLSEATLKDLLEWCASNHIECLYFLAESDDPQTVKLAETNGFQLTGVRVTFEWTLSEIPRMPTGVTVRSAREEDIGTLRTIARTAHQDTRFYFDRHFERSKCDLFYETWIENSFRGFAKAVLVAEVDRKPVAYITGHLQSEEAQIGIMGVAEEHRKAGLGSVMIQQLLSWAAQNRARRVTVVTQGRNVGAQRLYQRNGFLTASSQLWYHRWFTT